MHPLPLQLFAFAFDEQVREAVHDLRFLRLRLGGAEGAQEAEPLIGSLSLSQFAPLEAGVLAITRRVGDDQFAKLVERNLQMKGDDVPARAEGAEVRRSAKERVDVGGGGGCDHGGTQSVGPRRLGGTP